MPLDDDLDVQVSLVQVFLVLFLFRLLLLFAVLVLVEVLVVEVVFILEDVGQVEHLPLYVSVVVLLL